MIRLITILSALILLVSCGETDKNTAVAADGAINKDAIRDEIKALEKGFEEAINNKKIDGIANYYAEDAESYLTGSEVLSGKTAILESTTQDFKTLPSGSKVAYTTTDLFIASDGLQAVEMGSYRATNAAGVLQRKGNFMAVFAKRNGKFVCIRDIDCPQ